MKGAADGADPHGYAASVARGLCAVVAGSLSSYTASYWLAAAVLRGAGSGFWYHLLVYAMSLCLLFGIMYLSSRAFMGRTGRNVFSILTEAMRKISAGDFDVAVPVDSGGRNNLAGAVMSSLNEMTEALRKMESMRQEFVSDVSHEIQSPLTSILGFTQALRDEQLDPTLRRHYLDIIESESRRLSGLSENLLRLSALDSRAQAVVMAPFRLDVRLRSALLALEPQWQAKRIEVEAELDPVTLTADEALLDQVWGNLIGNAVKFTPEGGRVRVRCHLQHHDVVVEVKDSGIGIAPQDLPLVFDRFYKADRARPVGQSAGGSGLGLSIVQKIVSLHGGTVRALSPGLGRGALFRVILPLTPGAERT